MVKRISDFVIKHSSWIIIVSIVFTAGISVFIKNLHIDNDIKNWVSPHSRIGMLPHYIDKAFGGTSPVLVVLENDDVFSYESLSTIRKISRTAQQYEEIDAVMSLTETVDMTSDEYGILIQDLFGETIPTNSLRIQELKEYILASPSYSGKIVSKDARSTMLFMKIKSGKKGDIITRKIKDMVMETIDTNTTKAYIGGDRAIMNDLSEMVVSDLWFLVPGVVIVLVLILFASFRTLRGVLLPLLTVMMSTLIALGLMGLLGGTFSMLGAALPVILIAVSSAYALHYLNRYCEAGSLYEKNEDTIIHQTSTDITNPILMSGLTTFFGFLSLVVSDLTIIRSFGVFISIGILFALALALLFVPALLHRLPLQRVTTYQKKKDLSHIEAGRFASSLTGFMLKYKWAIIALYILLSGLSLLFMKNIRPELDFISYFKPDSQTTQVSKVINRNFGGFNPFSFYIKGKIQDADIQKLMLVLEENTKTMAPMSSMGGIHRVTSELNYLTTGIRTLPETTDEVNNLWFFIEGQDDISSMITSDKKEALISFMLPSVASSFEKKLYVPLQQFLNDYSSRVMVVEIQPTNHHITHLVTIMLSNRMVAQGLTNQGLEQRLPGLVMSIAQDMMIQKAFFPRQKIINYLLSEECEIEIKDRGQARRISGILEGKSSLASMSDSLHSVLAVYDHDTVSSLAESIYMMLVTEERVQKLAQASKKAQAVLGSGIPYTELEYALGPLLWSSMPVASDRSIDPVRIVELETLKITGTSWLYYQVKGRVTRGQLLSILLAVIAVFFLNTYTFKSIKIALLSMVPILFTLLMNFGIMGLLDIPLDVVTAIIASIAIGTGIDYTIHFITRYRIEYSKYNGDREKAISLTLSTVGKGILYNALSVGAGFLVLLFANVMPMRTLGLMLAVSMLVSSTSALILLPLLMHEKEIIKSVPEED